MSNIKQAIVSYNPHTDKTLVRWVDGGIRKQRSFSDATTVSNFISSLNAKKVKYKSHPRESNQHRTITVGQGLSAKVSNILKNAVKSPQGCLILDKPYKAITYRNSTYRAHRLVYFSYHPEQDQNVFVRSTCNNPYCVNPEHLYVPNKEPVTSKVEDEEDVVLHSDEQLFVETVEREVQKEIKREYNNIVRVIQKKRSVEEMLDDLRISKEHNYFYDI